MNIHFVWKTKEFFLYLSCLWKVFWCGCKYLYYISLLYLFLFGLLGLYLKGHDVTKLASMAKLKGGRLVREAADITLQYWGGMGYIDGLMSRLYRDTRLLSIGGGADEVMLGIICKYMDTLPRKWISRLNCWPCGTFHRWIFRGSANTCVGEAK